MSISAPWAQSDTTATAEGHAACALEPRTPPLAPPVLAGREGKYHRSFFFHLLEHGLGLPEGGSIIDVGSGAPPFLEHITWIKDRAILGPFFRMHGKDAYHSWIEPGYKAPEPIRTITQDFESWRPDKIYDIAICMQTLEHMEDAAGFLAKLRKISRTTIISVPYMWQDFGMATHFTHNITEATVASWNLLGEGTPPASTTIVDEQDKFDKVHESFNRHMIQVYHNTL